jgi:hypothetical protein
MNYFPHTKPKNWKAIEALYVYDKEYSGCTFFSILEILKSDLVQYKVAQSSLKKHIDRILEDVKVRYLCSVLIYSLTFFLLTETFQLELPQTNHF